MADFSREIQAKAARCVEEAFSSYENRMLPRKTQLLAVFEAYSSFKEAVDTTWSTSFKINKAHEVIEKILPSMTAKNPKWIVSVRDTKAFEDSEEIKDKKEQLISMGQQPIEEDFLIEKQEAVKIQAEAIQDYLTYIFDEYGLMEKVELYAKNGIADGKSYADVVYKVEKARVPTIKVRLDEYGNPVYNEGGEIVYDKGMEEKVVGEYPTIDVVDWTDIYYDSRYSDINDRPAMIRLKDGVRFADLKLYSKRYMNLDLVEQMLTINKECGNNRKSFKEKMWSLVGIQISDDMPAPDANSLTLKYYYGYFNETEEKSKERLYKLVTVNDTIVIFAEEIASIPIIEWKCFPNAKDANAVGFVEPIIGLQDEMNFKKNSASEYINKALRRQRIWSEQSGINPKTINDQVIPTSTTGQVALANFPEVPFSSIGADYFNEQNDFERQIQSATHTIDVANPRSQNALTDTATGAKIKFYESNKVLDAVRRRFERALERMAYKLIQCAFENMEDNIVLKKMGTEKYWFVNKEALRDAITKYTIKIETGSSSYNNMEDRRDEAIAWYNILAGVDAQLANAGSQRRVDFVKLVDDIGSTFEKKDPMKYLTTPSMGAIAQEMSGQPQMIEEQQGKPSDAQELTKQIAGNI